MGFCFINNIAVTAKYLQNKYKVNKIAIIDFDVHHGNGTQEIFYKDESVAYGSSHEFPLFPGTGSEQNGLITVRTYSSLPDCYRTGSRQSLVPCHR